MINLHESMILGSMIFSVVSHTFVSNGWNLMKNVINIYDYGVVMHVQFHQDVIR